MIRRSGAALSEIRRGAVKVGWLDQRSLTSSGIQRPARSSRCAALFCIARRRIWRWGHSRGDPSAGSVQRPADQLFHLWCGGWCPCRPRRLHRLARIRGPARKWHLDRQRDSACRERLQRVALGDRHSRIQQRQRRGVSGDAKRRRLGERQLQRFGADSRGCHFRKCAVFECALSMALRCGGMITRVLRSGLCPSIAS
jgi:hypothetical protein